MTRPSSRAARTARRTAGALLAVRGAAALALISYGAWSVYRPAGFLAAGLLLLADLISDARGGGE